MIKTGFVVGKFLPLHKGHELVINTALTYCEKVVVLSYTSKNFPNARPADRLKWLQSAFADKNVEVHVLENDFPDDEASEIVHRDFCSDFILKNIPEGIGAIFGSDDYIHPFANHVQRYIYRRTKTNNEIISYIVDKTRTKFPTSGTSIRDKIMSSSKSEYLNPEVSKSFIPKVIIFGGESSGKSTLALALAKRLKTYWVPEYGRQYYDEHGDIWEPADFLHVAKTQIQMEKLASSVANKVIVCDTNPITTYFYSTEMLGHASHELVDLMIDSIKPWDKVYVCDPRIEFEQDGTRRDSEFRMTGHKFYVDFLKKLKIEFKIVSGDVSNRIKFIEDDLRMQGII